MCINTSLVCNGIKNCVYPWYENNCKEKRKASILDNLGHTNVTITIVTCGLVVVLLIVASIIQVKQPRKKYIIRRDDFEATLFYEDFKPPHYELCTLRRAASADHMNFEKFNKLR
ncbi:neuropilin and tolloid-like protein 1 isoform X2 [Oncorhynchus kisutch]|nr:neuropilin and tolloid-like protein 1 isoform X2 [Oncorhynchus kisutch]XP_031665929.1 neuropilin and tolloid-like protein 1 isoform X2 [Oncorhynchus kisutch]XP_031665930.1 neuropilin and tolloid-like protein 1 isoform X2 [Oncorhynchus kisutch]